MSAELKPCPFCGAMPFVVTTVDEVRYYACTTVGCLAGTWCSKCRRRDPISSDGWNRRAPSPDLDRLRGENERLRAEGDDLRKKLSDLLRYHNFTPNLEKIN